MEENKITDDGRKKTWTTGEELLLTCAVKRHGSKNWTSVAMELQIRTSQTPTLPTPRDCQQKYEDLRRRFTDHNRTVDELNGSSDRACLVVPWLDELKKLRVCELRQEVLRRDASIQSLQLKVEKMKEERGDNGSGNERRYLEFDEENERCQEEGNPSPSFDKSASADESVRGNHSCNESNSTGVKGAIPLAGSQSGNVKSESQGRRPVIAGNSYKGSTDTQQQDKKAKLNDGAWIDAYVESKREGRVESSDMQSSASLSRSRRRRQRGKKKTSAGEFTEVDGVNEAVVGKNNPAESEPWATLLQIIRAHEHSSFFEGSIRSQEYKRIVRKHLDLGTVQSRLRRGHYTSSLPELRRDLILLFTNFIVSFPHTSPESIAAHELRSLVSNYQHHLQTPQVSSEPYPPPPRSNPNSDFESNSLFANPSSRKRSDPQPNLSFRSLSQSPEETQITATSTRIRSSARRRNPKTRKRKRVKNMSTQPPKRRAVVVDFLKRIKLNDSSGPNPSPIPSPSTSPSPNPNPSLSSRSSKKVLRRNREPMSAEEVHVLRRRGFRR